jgi:hypothetical protein
MPPCSNTSTAKNKESFQEKPDTLYFVASYVCKYKKAVETDYLFAKFYKNRPKR